MAKKRIGRIIRAVFIGIAVWLFASWLWSYSIPTLHYAGTLPAKWKHVIPPTQYFGLESDVVMASSPDGRFELRRHVRAPICLGCGSGNYPDFLRRGTVTLSVYERPNRLRARTHCVMYWPDDSYIYELPLGNGKKYSLYYSDPIFFSPDGKYLIIDDSIWSFSRD